MFSFLKRGVVLGALENTIIEILWTQGESNVHDVVRLLDRPLAYTTVMTTLDRLYKKGLLHRRKVERAFLYSPSLSRTEFERQRATEFLSNCSGDALISCLVEAAGEGDGALLDELEKRIRVKREELDRRRRT